MKFLRTILDKQGKLFEKGGKLEKLYPLYEATDTFAYTPGETTHGPSHVRDAVDLKRLMFTVVVALIPAVFMAMYNTGLQAHKAISAGAAPLDSWQTALFVKLMGESFDPANLFACLVHGALYYIPVVIVTLAIGGNCEALFAVIRKHEINEGFLVTWMLFPLILPPTIPLWQVAMGIAFGVIIGKEIFGGTGMNILNPALTARAFLFFAYPGQISGDNVWIAAQTSADGYSGATWLAQAAVDGKQALVPADVSWWDAFVGLVPGSMGETSALACLIGAVILILSGIGSWRIMAGVTVGSFVASGLLNLVGSTTNPFFDVPFYWHIVLGGWAFGMVFMATDPVSAAHTNKGRWVYGILIGFLAIIIRVVNPAYPEGMMLAILFMNLFASFIDHFVVKANIKRRRARYAA
ncbi:MAG: NADH:ubiquinone reductase (Na(+)-transporting) subunit B [Deltaproteobacteria bacterium]|nr:NADH:ubiquinone reductase (Na(+)-transporting) subunit B [Deltaproteobacteria bacterium]